MKKVIFLLAALVGISSANGQGCLPQGITFTSQSAIDNFQNIYPGCIEIWGDVEINADDITNLNGLSVLTSIGGGFNIQQCGMTSLSGLNNLTSIGGYFVIQLNFALTNLSELNNLTSIGGYFVIWLNSALTSISGLENLTSIEEYLMIFGNDDLNNLNGLVNLTSIGGNLSISSNSSLTSLNGLQNVTSIDGNLSIGNNNILTSLSGLENIDPNSIPIITIHGNTNLSECDIQNICEYLAVGGTIDIYDNAPGCSSLEELEEQCLTDIEDQWIENGITIIPNPSNDKITISSPLITRNTLLSIFNVSGEKVIEIQLTETETQLDISALPRGVYFVRVQDEKGIEVGKIIKQ